MFSLNHMIKSVALPRSNLNSRKTSRQDRKTINITTSVHVSNFSSTSTSQPPQILSEESYSAKTGIKTAALLGGMLLFAVVYLMWKARSRLCRSLRFSSKASNRNNAPLASTKFDLDYWLQQVDLLELKEAERNRESLLPYLELPTERPRDAEKATASWIVDTWRQWRLVQYREQHQSLFRQQSSQQDHSNPTPYRRRRYILRRFLRRLLTSSHKNPLYSIEHSSSFLTEMRPSIVNNNLIPPPDILDVQPRRVASWPRLKSTQNQHGTMLSALQTHHARKRLLKRTSRTTQFDY